MPFPFSRTTRNVTLSANISHVPESIPPRFLQIEIFLLLPKFLLSHQVHQVHVLVFSGAGITISAARYSSEDAAVLVEYVISIVEYTRRCGPLKQALDSLNQLEAEKEKIQLAEAEDQNVSAMTVL